MTELVGWLREQLDDDERVARAASTQATHLIVDADVVYLHGDLHASSRCDDVGHEPGKPNDCDDLRVAVLEDDVPPGLGEHIARWDPTRVLAEVAAKRAVLEECMRSVDNTGAGPGEFFLAHYAIKLLAQPYAGRPGWRGEWTA